jgi:pilus assembly protein FimV
MIITCKECNSSFNVDDGLIKETGSKVRCSKCENIFVAYPHSPEDDLLLGSDEQLLGSDGSSELDDLDSSLDDFFSEDESFETAALQKDADDELGLGLGLDPQIDEKEDTPAPALETEESELALGDFEDKLDMEPGPGIEDKLEDTVSELGLDLDLGDGAGPDTAEESMIGDELPDLEGLEELSALADDPLALDDTDAALGDHDLGLEAEEKQETTDREFGVDDELDLADLDLGKEESTELEAPSTNDSEDLNLDLLLDQDAETQQGDEISDAGAAVEETDELDLSDFDLENDDAPAAETASEKDSEDLDFDLGLEPETIAGDAENIADELDISDLEAIIDSEPDEPAENSPAALELDLELEDDQETRAADATAAADDDDELDFSDLENMFESSETPEPSGESDDADELDLQFNIDEPVTGVSDTSASGDADDVDQEDDLLDIEKMLGENQDTAGEDLNSPLEMDAAPDDASKEEDDLELEFDLESELQEKEDFFDGSATADEQLESNLLTSDETGTSDKAGIEEVDFEEEELQGAVTTDEFATDELLETSDAYDAPPVTDAPPSAPAAMMPKSRSKKPVLVALLLLFLAGGILIVPNILGIKIPYISDIKIPYLSDLDIKIPYLSDKLNPKEKDVAGNLKIVPLGGTISARFVNDSQGNQRFVIHGKIKNDYDHPRSFIKVTGKIYQKGGKLAKTETVYCGNMLSDSELTGMKIAAINKRLHNRFGTKKSNLKVKTGKTIPFMIVFDKLPQNLDEYTVEVDGSSI